MTSPLHNTSNVFGSIFIKMGKTYTSFIPLAGIYGSCKTGRCVGLTDLNHTLRLTCYLHETNLPGDIYSTIYMWVEHEI